jgi:hypothetical protein
MTSGTGQYHTNEPHAKIRHPYTSIDLTGIRALVDSPKSVDKAQGQWLIPSTLPTRTFAKQEEEGEFWMLWADLDADPKPISEVDAVLRGNVIPEYDFELYTSRSAREDLQKARILIPLSRPMSGSDWMLCQELFGDKLAAAGIIPDRAAERPAQLCYLPNRGVFYSARSVREGKLLNPILTWAAEVAAKRKAIVDATLNLERDAIAAAARREAMKLEVSPDAIGAFNHAYTVMEILQRAGYDQRGNSFRHPRSESGSFSASVKDGRVHSLSSSDPLFTSGSGGGAHDAFGAFALLWAGGDHNAALKLAGDEWLAVGGESWNQAKRREYVQRIACGSLAVAHDRETGTGGKDNGIVLAGDSCPPKTSGYRAYPPPFRGVMDDLVGAALAVSIKPQPAISTLAALIGMAASCTGHFALPSGMRLNLYGCGVAQTGDGKEQPRSIATTLVKATGGNLIGKPASGPGLEDAIQSYVGTLASLDEIAHFFKALNSSNAPPHLIELASALLQFFSASREDYQTRVRAIAQGASRSRTISHPMLNIIGFATPEKLGEALSVGNVEDGLLGRFLFAFGQPNVPPQRRNSAFRLPARVCAAAEALREATQPVRDQGMPSKDVLDCVPILIDPAAETRFAELLVEFDQACVVNGSAFAKALLIRSCEKCERVAGVLAVWDSPTAPGITLEHVNWAEQLLLASDTAVQHFSNEYMHGGQTQANAKKVLRLIERAANGDFKPQKRHESGKLPAGAAPYSMVMRSSKLAKREFDDAVAHLGALGEAELIPLPSRHPNGRVETMRCLVLKA